MELSRHNGFRLCSRDFSGQFWGKEKGQFCFISQKNCNWNKPPLPFLYVFQSSIAASTLLTYSYQPPIPTVYSKPSKFTTAINLQQKSTIRTTETYKLGILIVILFTIRVATLLSARGSRLNPTKGLNSSKNTEL